jgi:Phospholipase_D-nuclease N-terminal
MQWTFGTFLWSMVVFFFWFAVIWMFVALFADVLRRDDLSGWGKAGWIILMVILPFIGILAYVIARPKVLANESDYAYYGPRTTGRRPGPNGGNPADEIARAARLQDEGKITPEEYERIKHHALQF